MLSLLTAWAIVMPANNMQNQDFFTFWLGGRLAGQNQNIYNPTIWGNGHLEYHSSWLENNYFVYPLPLALILIPLGWLSLNSAAILWISLSMFVILGMSLYFIGVPTQKKDWAPLVFILIGVITFRPVIVTELNGQLGAVYLSIIFLVAYLFQTNKPWMVGVLLSLLLLKPTLGFSIAGLLCVYFLLNRMWKPVVSFISTTAILLIISWLMNPAWLSAFLNLGFSKGSGVTFFTPTWWGLAGAICQLASPCSSWLGLAGSISIALIGIIVVFKNRTKWDIWSVAAWAILIALQITPYLWAYDQILLLFPLFLIIRKLLERPNKIFAITLSICISLIALILLYVATQIGHDRGSYWLTIIFVFIWYLSTTKGSYGRKQSV